MQSPILWDYQNKEIPPRPGNPHNYPPDDERAWYDAEFAGWDVRKKNIPEPPSGGPSGKHIIVLLPGEHPYLRGYQRGFLDAAPASGFQVEFRSAGWRPGIQEEQVQEAIRRRPDLILLSPEDTESGTDWYCRINQAGIPVMASNLMPSSEGFQYILSWTGPDDWGQFRLLSRTFAGFLDNQGGYGIIQHKPGTSAYYARTWSVITELKKIAPAMELLEMDYTGFDRDQTEEVVSGWIKKHGRRLRGIVSADDQLPQIGINEAVRKAGREDIVRVANGSTKVGLEFIKAGTLHAVTYQSPIMDGALACKTAADWFSGFEVEPIRYLPKYIITIHDVDDFLQKENELRSVDLEYFFQIVNEGRREEVIGFFEQTYGQFLHTRVVSLDYFRGFSVEVLSNLLAVIRINGLPVDHILGGYESLFRGLFRQKTLEDTMEWMQETALQVVDHLEQVRSRNVSSIERIVGFVRRNYASPLSLKTLADRFQLSAPYLGKQFHSYTGKKFNEYLLSLRMEQAKRLLQQRNLSAGEIGRRVGYDNPDYFYVQFRKYSGMTPSRYRENEGPESPNEAETRGSPPTA